MISCSFVKLILFLITDNVAPLYISPVSKKPIFNLSARPLPRVVLPEAVGPSMAMLLSSCMLDFDKLAIVSSLTI
jgi:hypothetical protein